MDVLLNTVQAQRGKPSRWPVHGAVHRTTRTGFSGKGPRQDHSGGRSCTYSQQALMQPTVRLDQPSVNNAVLNVCLLARALPASRPASRTTFRAARAGLARPDRLASTDFRTGPSRLLALDPGALTLPRPTLASPSQALPPGPWQGLFWPVQFLFWATSVSPCTLVPPPGAPPARAPPGTPVALRPSGPAQRGHAAPPVRPPFLKDPQ